MWDRWVEHLSGPDAAPADEPEPWAVRVLHTALALTFIAAALVVADALAGINWGWIPWKQMFVLAAVVVALAGAGARAGRALYRRARGLPELRDARAAKRDTWAERLRELDEPYRRRERTTVGD